MAFRQAALTGATIQMFSHGIITGMLFFCVGVIYDQAHTREIAVFGGVAKRMPMLGTLFTFAAMASLGLPGLAGFVAEYMVFTSSYPHLADLYYRGRLYDDPDGGLPALDAEARLLRSIQPKMELVSGCLCP